jgi:hypothetical protein
MGEKRPPGTFHPDRPTGRAPSQATQAALDRKNRETLCHQDENCLRTAKKCRNFVKTSIEKICC